MNTQVKIHKYTRHFSGGWDVCHVKLQPKGVLRFTLVPTIMKVDNSLLEYDFPQQTKVVQGV